MEKLGKYVKIQTGKLNANASSDTGQYPFFTCAIEPLKIDNYAYDCQCVLVAGNGDLNVKYYNGKFNAYQRTYIIESKDKNILDTKFLKLFLDKSLEKLRANTKGGIIKYIRLNDLTDLKINLPDLLTQKRIAKILSHTETLIAKRKESIQMLDKFVKATFLEMFGDPVRNEKGWVTRTIEELVRNERYAIKRGPFGGALKKEVFVNDGYLVYEQYHALNNDFSFARYFINEDKFQELRAFEVKHGDIIISCSGVYLGKLAVVPDNARPGIINQALLKISLDNNIITNSFFYYLFTHENFKRKFFGSQRGGGIPNFPPMSEFKKFKFIYPPFLLQQQFSKIVDKIEALKKQFEQSLQELQNLYGSLSQRAFKGELDLSKVEIYDTEESEQREDVMDKNISGF